MAVYTLREYIFSRPRSYSSRTGQYIARMIKERETSNLSFLATPEEARKEAYSHGFYEYETFMRLFHNYISYAYNHGYEPQLIRTPRRQTKG